MNSREEAVIDGRTLSLSKLDKVLYPAAEFTKGAVIDYYRHIGPFILAHLKDRALTLKRYPDGVEGGFFYEKRCPSYRPSWVKTASIWSKTNRARINYCLANDLPSLIWAANLACLELHTSLARHQHTDQPTMVIFDLDPGPGTDVLDCGEVAVRLRDLLAGLPLKSFPKTSGSKGLQVYVPLNAPVTFEQTKYFAHRIANALAGENPDQVIARMERKPRKGRVFIDWSQNDRHKTTVCAYSLRAMAHPTVSTPVKWSEIEAALRGQSAKRLVFEAEDVLKRVGKLGDLFEPVLKLRQKLPQLD